MKKIETTEKKPAQSGLFADKSDLVLEGERADDLQFRELKLIQSPSAFCFGTDSILLTHFALPPLLSAKKDSRIIDLGAGSGVISLLLAAKTEVAKQEKRKEEQALSLGEAGTTWQKAAHAQMLSNLAQMAAEDEYELDENEESEEAMVAEPGDPL